MSLLQAKLGIQFKQKNFATLDDILKGVRNGDVHIVNAVTKTPARSEYITFTNPFIAVPNVIIVKKDRSGQMTEKDLSGLKVSLVKSYAVTEHLANQPLGFIANLVPDDLTALLNVSFGLSDAAIIDLATASYLIEQKGITNLRVAGETAFNIQLSMGSTITEPILSNILQKGLGAITEADRQKIHKRWIAASNGSVLADWRFQVFAGGILFVILAVATAILVWNRALRKQVDARTKALASEKEALREREEDLRESQRIAHVGSWRLDVASNQVVWSDELYKMYGFDPELPPPPYTEHQKLFTPESWNKLSVALQTTRETGTPYDLELETLQADGSHGWMWVHGMAVLNASGVSIGLRGVAQDITERKRTEEKIRESNEYLENLITYANVPIIVWDMQFRITRFNHAFEQITGRSADEVKGEPIEILFPSAQVEKSMVLIKETLKGERWQDIEINIQHRDGSVRTVLWNSATIHGADGNIPIAIIAQGYDITERKQAEEEKKKLTIQLYQAQKMEAIGTLAGGIAHDFINILGAILGYAEMIRDDCPTNSIVAHDIDQVIKAGNRAKELVKQILAFSRQSEATKLPVQPAPIITEAIKMLRASLPTTITIEQDIDSEAGVILADPTQIHQILMNLGTNAFHAMEINGGTLTISLHKKTLHQEDLGSEKHMRPGRFVQFSIKDTGVGIAPEILNRIFDPYFTTKEVGKGTGMGLAMVHGIVQSYGGSITCNSQLGKGTIFQIMLPVVETDFLQETEPTELIPVGREHILLVDDEEMLIELSKVMLERLGYRVTTRTSSIEALTTFRNQPKSFDLMITDQTMPGLTGVDLARLRLQIRPDLPIILCTGYSTLISEEKAESLGIKGFALKPLTKKDMGILIRKVLDGKK